MHPFPREFYARKATLVARDLIGAKLIHAVENGQIMTRIIEVEAYSGKDDLASHGRVGRTPRNLPMWEQPGHAYVYLCYGMYWLLNVVCELEDHPAAVLIRGVEPVDGLDLIAQNRPDQKPKNWTNGPGRVTKALGVTGNHNRLDLTTTASGLWITAGDPVPDEKISTGARVGMGKSVYEPWLNMPWRWWEKGNPNVSHPTFTHYSRP